MSRTAQTLVTERVLVHIMGIINRCWAIIRDQILRSVFHMHISFTAHHNPATLYNLIIQMVNNGIPNYLTVE